MSINDSGKDLQMKIKLLIPFLVLLFSWFGRPVFSYGQDLVIDLTKTPNSVKANKTEINFHRVFLENKELDSINPHFSFDQPINRIMVKTGSGETDLLLPEEIRQRLAIYLEKGISQALNQKISENADCFIWASYMKNTHISFLDHEGSPFPIIEDIGLFEVEIKENSLKAGDSLKIFKPETNQFHYALYLGNNIYVSKFGKWGLFFTDLRTMKQFFGFGEVKGFKLHKLVITKKAFNEIPYGAEYSHCTMDEYVEKFKENYSQPQAMWEFVREKHPCTSKFKNEMDRKLKKEEKNPPSCACVLI